MSAPAKVPVGLLVKLAIAGVVLLAAAVLLLRGVDLRGLAERVFASIRSAGPWIFFSAMAILPAFGCPILAFYFAAGPTFGEQMGLPAVIGASLAAVAANLALTYWLAHRGVRPLVEWLLGHTRYRVPQVKPENQMAVAILLRVTPGPPFFVQSYILGLAGVRFRTYMVVSFGAHCVMGVGAIVFGRAMMEGKGGLAFLGASILLAMVVLVQWARRYYARRNANAP